MAPFDITPRTIRRALRPEEIRAVLEAAAPHHRLLLETAFLTGLRVHELRSLEVEDLDGERGGVRLHAEWTKNRKAGFQPVPRALLERLREFAASGAPKQLYARFGTKKVPAHPLLFVPSHPARALDEALR
ncbi:MAG: tyrosine-type recombinase/integrase, partial [Candidatus Latescibacterota bacterium]